MPMEASMVLSISKLESFNKMGFQDQSEVLLGDVDPALLIPLSHNTLKMAGATRPKRRALQNWLLVLGESELGFSGYFVLPETHSKQRGMGGWGDGGGGIKA